MRWVFGVAALVSSAAAASDVVPHCGGPNVSIVSPGGECGAHGSRWRGECRAPGQCLRFAGSGHETCSLKCKQDADCAVLGENFACSGHVADYGSEQTELACVRRLTQSSR